MTENILFCLGLDTECDKDLEWNTRFPLQFTSILEGIPKKLTPLFGQYGIKPTYFLSPEVLQHPESVRFLSQLANCELGTHLHGEYVGPNAEMNAQKTSMVQAEMSSDEEKGKLEQLTELFINQIGYSPKSFRAGRFGLSKDSLQILNDLDYKVDSSITPFYSHDFSNGIKSNYWGAPIQPYHPSRKDFRNKGKLKLLEVPITVINPTLLQWPSSVLKRMHNRSFIHKRLLPRLGIKVEKTSWLRPKYSTSSEMISISDQLIKYVSGKHIPVLNMMYHPNEVIPGASPYAATEEDVDYILATQKTYFEYLFNKYRVKCVGISEVVEYFQ